MTTIPMAYPSGTHTPDNCEACEKWLPCGVLAYGVPIGGGWSFYCPTCWHKIEAEVSNA